MNDTTRPVTGSYLTVFAAYTTPAPPDGGPRQARADLVEVFYEIGPDGVRETGHRILHSGLTMLTVDGDDAYLNGDDHD
jgi:hypothetical protein